MRQRGGKHRDLHPVDKWLVRHVGFTFHWNAVIIFGIFVAAYLMGRADG